MIVLGIETSCDETSVAVVQNGRVLANRIASQLELHAEYGGVVPELATRAHLANLPTVARSALEQAGVVPEEISAVAATRGPGLPSALMVGWRFAQAFAFARTLPCIGIHHHEAHLYSPWIAGSPLRADWDRLEPHLCLIVSGGHTLLVRVEREFEHHVLGATIDDAAGECFDKIARLLGLPYPGGPALDQLAEEGDPASFPFPRPMLGDPQPDFSFSGLKTAVRYFVRDHPDLLKSPETLRHLCASVRAAIVEVLVTKTVRTAARERLSRVTAAGGVTCNRLLRRELARACAAAGLSLRLADPALATDNAAMVAVLGERRLERFPAPGIPDLETDPSWSFDQTGLAARPDRG